LAKQLLHILDYFDLSVFSLSNCSGHR